MRYAPTVVYSESLWVFLEWRRVCPSVRLSVLELADCIEELCCFGGWGGTQCGIPSSCGSQIEIKDCCGVSSDERGDENVKRSFRGGERRETMQQVAQNSLPFRQADV